MTVRVIFLALALAGLTACQSHHAAMEIICNASTECAPCRAADAPSRATFLAQYISDRVTNSEAVQMFSSFPTLDPAQRAPILRREAAREGISPCPMAEEMEENLTAR